MRNYVIGSVVGHIVVVVLGHWLSLSSTPTFPELETVRVSLAQLPEASTPPPAPPKEVAVQPPPSQPEVQPDIDPEPEPDLVPPEPDLPPKPKPEPEKPKPEKPKPDPVVPDELPEPEPVVPVKNEAAEATGEESVDEETTVTEMESVSPEASVQMTAPAGVDDYYLATTQRKIGRRWEPTAAMARGQRNVKTVVAFRIGPGGEIMFPEVVESSGLSVFDRQALRAVVSANPLPKPPPRFARTGLSIRFTFVYNP